MLMKIRDFYWGLVVLIALTGCMNGPKVAVDSDEPEGEFAGKEISELFQTVQKVVQLKGEVEQVLLSAADESATPVPLLPGVDSGSHATVYPMMDLAVVGEEDDYYHVVLPVNGGIEGYISKQLVREAETGRISPDSIYTNWYVPSFECGGGVTVVRRPYGNRLVTMYTELECDANTLKLGIWQDGIYVFSYEIFVASLTYDENKTGFSLKWVGNDDYPCYEGTYGKDMCRIVQAANGSEWTELDWVKVDEDMLADIFSEKLERGERSVSLLTAAGITEGKNLKPEDFGEEE
jgi:hypothetical protein